MHYPTFPMSTGSTCILYSKVLQSVKLLCLTYMFYTVQYNFIYKASFTSLSSFPSKAFFPPKLFPSKVICYYVTACLVSLYISFCFFLQNSMSEIAQLFTEFFRDLDVVPSDVIAGLVLLRRFQKLRMQHTINQVITAK
mgnify:CR=1 FL=1